MRPATPESKRTETRVDEQPNLKTCRQERPSSPVVRGIWERHSFELLRAQGREVLGLDVLDSPFTDRVGSITDRAVVKECIQGAESILHTATLHKPHVGTHDRQAFIETNVIGTTVLLEEAVAAGVSSLCLHQYDECLRAGTRSVPGIAHRLDHRGRRPYSKEYLWGDRRRRRRTSVSWSHEIMACR